jgi:flagellar biosynthesis chaperone FliJ
MAVKKDEKALNVIDVFWDSWFNSFKTFNSLQNGAEEKSLQAFESQKEWIQATRDQLTQLEEESKKLTSEWKSNLQEVLNKAQIDFGTQNLTEWTDKFEEIGHKAEALAFSPSKATIDLLSKSHAQLESALKKAIDQQQKNRAEVLNAIGGYVDQLKQTQNGVLKTFELYNPLIAK